MEADGDYKGILEHKVKSVRTTKGIVKPKVKGILIKTTGVLLL